MTSPIQSLQHTEAQARFALLRLTSYDVTLDLSRSETSFGSITELRFESQGGPTFLDLKPRALRSVSLNDRPVDVDLLDRGRLPIDTMAGANVLVVDAEMAFRNDGEGLHRSVDPADGRHYVYGMCFMDAAPSVFACFDQPDLKAPYTMHVTAPSDWVVVGNAPASNPEPGVWEIGPTQPLSTYFVTIVAGPYHVLREEHDGIPLGLSTRQSLAGHLDAEAGELFTLTRQCFDEYHRLFGIRYPFGDYHQAFVPEFNAGAMENPGCVTFRDSYVFDTRVTRAARIARATTVAHEMAHQWFGNITTPTWWDDLWLNESFAEYMGNRVTADVTQYADARASITWARRHWGLSADQRPSTHPVAGNGAVDAVAALQDFDGISYAKGSTILKQLCSAMGDATFFAGAVDHFTQHRFANATLHDLIDSWTRQGADLTGVVDQWLRTAGPDTFTLDRASAALARTPPAAHPAEREHIFALLSTSPEIGSVPTWTSTPVHVTGPVTPLGVDLGDDVVVLDPGHDSWGVYVPDPTTVRGLAGVLASVEDAELVAAIWTNVKSGYSVAAVDPDDIVDLALAAFPAADAEDTARHTLPWLVGDVLPLAGDGAAARLHAGAVSALTGAEPGSERQLAAFRAAVRTTPRPEALRGWLGELPDGLVLDSDLRWRMLVRLAALGATDVPELDAALAEGPTATTTVEHTRAVASLPTPAAKAFAWERFTGAVDVPNYELAAAGLGMWRGGQEELTAPYVERYFTDLPGTSAVRSGWNLATSAGAFFPRGHDGRTLELAGDLLARQVLEPAVARVVADLVDDLVRLTAVRAAFPKG